MSDNRLKILAERVQEVKSAPVLRRVNGIGFTLLGSLWDDVLNPPLHIQMYWFTFLWIPLIPLAVYIVHNEPGGMIRFQRKLSLEDFHSLYRGRLLKFYGSVVAESLMYLGVVLVAIVVVGLMVSMIWGRR